MIPVGRGRVGHHEVHSCGDLSGRVDRTGSLSDLNSSDSAELQGPNPDRFVQSSTRGDNYGIASFTISNTSDKAINSIELTCWVNDDREHGTKVLVWPSRQSIAAHDQEQFSKVNIGLVGPSARPECEVTRTD